MPLNSLLTVRRIAVEFSVAMKNAADARYASPPVPADGHPPAISGLELDLPSLCISPEQYCNVAIALADTFPNETVNYAYVEVISYAFHSLAQDIVRAKSEIISGWEACDEVLNLISLALKGLTPILVADDNACEKASRASEKAISAIEYAVTCKGDETEQECRPPQSH
jgi:hypothetical protein